MFRNLSERGKWGTAFLTIVIMIQFLKGCAINTGNSQEITGVPSGEFPNSTNSDVYSVEDTEHGENIAAPADKLNNDEAESITDPFAFEPEAEWTYGWPFDLHSVEKRVVDGQTYIYNKQDDSRYLLSEGNSVKGHTIWYVNKIVNYMGEETITPDGDYWITKADKAGNMSIVFKGSEDIDLLKNEQNIRGKRVVVDVTDGCIITAFENISGDGFRVLQLIDYVTGWCRDDDGFFKLIPDVAGETYDQCCLVTEIEEIKPIVIPNISSDGKDSITVYDALINSRHAYFDPSGNYWDNAYVMLTGYSDKKFNVLVNPETGERCLKVTGIYCGVEATRYRRMSMYGYTEEPSSHIKWIPIEDY